jgi:hypothetical protein
MIIIRHISKSREIKKNRKFFETLFDDFLKLSNRKNLVEKTPSHIAYVPVIAEFLPDARFAVICRDKKDTVASYVKTFEMAANHFKRFTPRWITLKKICDNCLYYERLESCLGNHERCRLVVYTELIEHPLETVASTLEWSGLTFDKQKHQTLFKPGKLNSHWDNLSRGDQSFIQRYLGM